MYDNNPLKSRLYAVKKLLAKFKLNFHHKNDCPPPAKNINLHKMA